MVVDWGWWIGGCGGFFRLHDGLVMDFIGGLVVGLLMGL